VSSENKAHRRGRPFAFDRHAVLARAAVTFWRLGYEGASIRELTDAMEITAQSLYAAFQSKEELYRQALEYYCVNFVGFMAEALTDEPSVVTSFERFFREAARAFASGDRPRGCMVSSGILAASTDNLAAAAQTAALRKQFKAAIQDKVASGVASGELVKSTPVAALARFLAASLQGMSVQARDGATERELLEVAVLINDQVGKYSLRKTGRRSERSKTSSP
jgi:AcrR family transcriptional regulator